MPHSPVFALADLQSQITRLERGGSERLDRPVLPFGNPRIATTLRGGGLARSALHELMSEEAVDRSWPARHSQAA